MFGESVQPHLSPFMEGRGRPARSGPLDGNGRRSIYLGVRRNFLDPMFQAFDVPVPFSTMGRRNVSNVPAQALALLNDPFVILMSRRWAMRLLSADQTSERDRVDQVFQTALARAPTEREVADCLAFLGRRVRSSFDQSVDAWADLCHVLINAKEFIYID
jgi:hypothetical protein